MGHPDRRHKSADHVEIGQYWKRGIVVLKVLGVGDGYAMVGRDKRRPAMLPLNELVTDYMQVTADGASAVTRP